VFDIRRLRIIIIFISSVLIQLTRISLFVFIVNYIKFVGYTDIVSKGLDIDILNHVIVFVQSHGIEIYSTMLFCTSSAYTLQGYFF